MFGNNGMQFTPADWQQLALTAGLSILGNNNGSRSVGQLIGQGGLDALAGLQARKQYEAAMARQQEQDAMAQQKHDLDMRLGQMQMDEQAQRAELMKRWMGGDQSVYKYLFPLQWAQDQRQAAAKGGGNTQPEFLPLDAAGRKELASLAQLDGFTSYFEDALDKAYTADENGFKSGGTGLLIGMAPNWAKSRFDPHGNEFRSAISNFSSQIMNWLSGAAVSEEEHVRLEGFLPTMYDDEDTLRAKLKGYRDFVRSKGDSWKTVYGDHATFGRMRTFTPKKGEAKKNADIPELPEGFEMVQ